MNNKPAEKFRIGALTATIWKNEGASGHSFYTVDIGRSYKDKEGAWKESTSFKSDDLLNVAMLCNRAEAWIADQAINENPDA